MKYGLVMVVAASISLSAQSSSPAPSATVNQIMRGILFINSNVVFLAQSDDPGEVTLDAQPSRAVNPLGGTFGRWEAVENAALAIVESAALLELPHLCSNGTPAPVKDVEWQKALDEMRRTATLAYKAAQAKSQDAIVDMTEPLATSCSHCHRQYRDASRDASRRCVK